VTDQHWFESVAAHLGRAYLRYSFTYGTENEIDFLVEALALEPRMRVLDVGCGPGRHAYELARRGIEVHGIDISERFIELASATAPTGASFERADARNLQYDSEFDAAISLCQGAFGLAAGPEPSRDLLDPDRAVLTGMARALKPGGRIAVSAFSAYFQVQYLEEGNEFDAAAGVHREVFTVKDEAGEEADFDAWTSCFTPRELRLLAAASGLRVVDIWSVSPGDYSTLPPSIATPEFLLLAEH
jgi:SAM-dependent methyltransferase